MSEPKSVFIERDGVRLHALDHGSEGEDKPILLMLHGAAAHAHWWDHIAPVTRICSGPWRRITAATGTPDGRMNTFSKSFCATWPPGWSGPRRRAGENRGSWRTRWAASSRSTSSLSSRPISRASSSWIPRPDDGRDLAEVRAFGNRPARPWASRELFVENSGSCPHRTSESRDHRPHRAPRRAAKRRRRMDGQGGPAIPRHPPRDDQRAGWRRVDVPALLVAGELSDRLKSDSLEWVHEKAPQVETTVIPGAHHHVFMDEPEAFIRITREFSYEEDRRNWRAKRIPDGLISYTLPICRRAASTRRSSSFRQKPE